MNIDIIIAKIIIMVLVGGFASYAARKYRAAKNKPSGKGNLTV